MAMSDNDGDSVDSQEEALCELLGLQSLEINDTVENKPSHRIQSLEDLSTLPDNFIHETIQTHNLGQRYRDTSVCTLPNELCIPAEIMRRITDQVVWAPKEQFPSLLCTYETIQYVNKDKERHCRRVLTRLENLNDYPGWNIVCDYLGRLASSLLQQPMALFKTKLNLKPPGGSGFAPHVDEPSLRVAFGEFGPKDFVTVMVAIDDMTIANGCLRLAKGRQVEGSCPIVLPQPNGNPDAEGRAGAIPLAMAETMDFEELEVAGGSIVLFHGWAPHRSGPNQSNFMRRAVFVTYHPQHYGDFHDPYYERMGQLRRNFVEQQQRSGETEKALVSAEELQALATVPRI